MRRGAVDRLNRLLHRIFEMSLLIKGAFALAEFGLGVGLYLIGPDALASTVHALTHHEIIEDPTDPVARFLLAQLAGTGPDLHRFYAFYLASHGLVKLVAVGLLLRGYLWAYPLGIAVLAGFVVYQAVLLSNGLSPGLILLTLLDLALIGLTWHEWRARLRTG